VLLFILLRRRIGSMGGRGIFSVFVRSFLASSVMVSVVWFVSFRWISGPPWIQVMTAIVGGVVVFWMLASMLKLEERRPFVEMFFKKIKSNKE